MRKRKWIDVILHKACTKLKAKPGSYHHYARWERFSGMCLILRKSELFRLVLGVLTMFILCLPEFFKIHEGE